ncbi:MAG: fatty acid desaturase [Acidobacteriota bacterium]
MSNPSSSAFSHATPQISREWLEALAPFSRPKTRRALIQLANTAIPFGVVWYLMYRSLEVSYALTLALAIPAAFLLIRLFIFQHDCGHGSFLPSRRWNNIIGSLIGVIMLTPYFYWRRTHAVHHATSGNLDRRELGDIDTLTVNEYKALPWYRRLGYRFYRNAAVMLLLGPLWTFIIKHRFPFDIPMSWRKEWVSIWLTNAAIAGILVWAWFTIGIGNLLMVQIPINMISGAIGIWLFYVQHQFEDTYWERQGEWSFERAGLEGSSFLDLPKVLHWLTGNIGYHHIHHLSSRIPNYRLRECLDSIPELRQRPVSIAESFKYARLKLWDEDSAQLVGFDALRRT